MATCHYRKKSRKCDALVPCTGNFTGEYLANFWLAVEYEGGAVGKGKLLFTVKQRSDLDSDVRTEV